jgi:large subunit ribosomal protein L25
MMSTTTVATDLVSKLPLRLRNFFARYPPQIYSAAVRPPVTEPETPAPAAEESLPSPYTPNRDAKGFKKPDPKAFSPSKSLLYTNPEHPNPFLPRKNFRNGKWIGPPIGLRRQAELVKLAIKYNVEALLPPGRKSTEYKETRRAERGLAIKGTGVGQKVKGHKWERTMEARLEDRRKAIMEMPEMIRLWKQVSIRLMLSVRLEGVEANLMRCTERSWSWLEAMAQEVNESMSISLLSHGISSCRIFFICQSSTHTAWLRLLYGSLTGFGMGVLVCICTVQIDILAKIAQSVPCFIVLLCMYTEPFKIRLQNWTASTTWPMQALL